MERGIVLTNPQGDTSETIKNLADYPTSRRTARTHKILMCNMDLTTTEYGIVLPEDAFAGGGLLEYCGYDGLVQNCDMWKNEIDILVISPVNKVSYLVESTPTQIKTAIQAIMAAGVFIVWYAWSTAASIVKYGPNGTFDTAQTAVLTDVFGIARASKDITGGTPTFSHSATYPFGAAEILRTECIPNNGYLNHFTSSDPLVNFPVVASNGTNTVNCVAYKPGVFMIIGDGGSATASVNTDAYFKYIKGDELIRIALGKSTMARLAVGYQYGRIIAAFGMDCCTLPDAATARPYRKAFRDKPFEWGLIPSQLTSSTAGYYRTLLAESKNESCTHTGNHFNTDITVTDETHIIGSDQLIQINNPFNARITSIKKSDDSVTYTVCSIKTISSSNPTVTEYAIDETASAEDHMLNGYVKFHADNIGVSIKVTYDYTNEAYENLGSIAALEELGCLTNKAVFMTSGYDSASPATLKAAKAQGVTLVDYGAFPCYESAYNITRTRDKRAFPFGGGVAKEGYNHVMVDTTLYTHAPAEAATYFVAGVARCVSKEIPIVDYCHSFMASDEAISVHHNVAYNAGWRAETLEGTRDIMESFMEVTWIPAIDAVNAYWLSRSNATKRYYYINENIKYDVVESAGGVTFIISSSGSETLKGATVRVPCASAPASVTLFKDQVISYTYADGIATAWFDLYPGETVALAVVF